MSKAKKKGRAKKAASRKPTKASTGVKKARAKASSKISQLERKVASLSKTATAAKAASKKAVKVASTAKKAASKPAPKPAKRAKPAKPARAKSASRRGASKKAKSSKAASWHRTPAPKRGAGWKPPVAKPKGKPTTGKHVAAGPTGTGHSRKTPGWYGKAGYNVEPSWVYYQNPSKPKRKSGGKGKRRMSAAQRAAAMRNLKKARAARKSSMARNPSKPKRKSGKGKAKTRKTSASRRRKGGKRNPGPLARRPRWARNPMKMLRSALKQAKPFAKLLAGGAVGFFASRALGNLAANIEAVPAGVRPYVPMAANVATAVAAYFLPRRVKALHGLRPYADGAATGALVAFGEALMAHFGPAELRAYVAPPTGLSGDVYERALRGGGVGRLNENWADYLPGDEELVMELEAADSMGEYVPEGDLAEYVVDDGMGEYVPEGDLAEYVVDDGMGSGMGLEVQGLDDFDVYEALGADELEADSAGGDDATVGGSPLLADEPGYGVFGGVAPDMQALDLTPANVARVVDGVMQAGQARGFTPDVKAVYSAVKAQTGSSGTPQLRRMVARAYGVTVRGGAAPVPAGVRAMPDQGAPMAVGNITRRSLYSEPDISADTDTGGGIFGGGLFH